MRTNDLLEAPRRRHVRSPPPSIDTAGRLEPTGNPLDVAIEGDGYFAVSDGQASRASPATGSSSVDREGRLILSPTTNGQKVLDDQAASRSS